MHRRPQSVSVAARVCSLGEGKGRGWGKGNPCRKHGGSVYEERPEAKMPDRCRNARGGSGGVWGLFIVQIC